MTWLSSQVFHIPSLQSFHLQVRLQCTPPSMESQHHEWLRWQRGKRPAPTKPKPRGLRARTSRGFAPSVYIKKETHLKETSVFFFLVADFCVFFWRVQVVNQILYIISTHIIQIYIVRWYASFQELSFHLQQGTSDSCVGCRHLSNIRSHTHKTQCPVAAKEVE